MSRAHRDEPRDAVGPSVRFPGSLHAVEDRVPVRAIERLEKQARADVARERGGEIRGTSEVWPPSYARSHRPSCFARSTSARPGGSMVPAAISASAFAQLILDHELSFVRDVKRWIHELSSNGSFWLSIQPHASATSNAAA